MDFKNKNILLFYPYGATKHYGEAIKQELLYRGATVVGYDERPSQCVIMKIIIRLCKKRVPQIFVRYINRVIEQNKKLSVDYVLVCRGEAFTNDAMDVLRKAYPTAKFILYLWDILETTNVTEVIPRFDKAMSFDPYDVERNLKLQFRPTFFIPQYTDVGICKKAKNDVLFIGTLHSKRYKIISFFKNYFYNQGITFYAYLYVPGIILFLKDKLLKYPYIDFSTVNFTPISFKDTLDKVKETKCILDINYSTQRSLSMRAYEALAAKRKYITTNPEVMKYDFYDSNNILVIDIENPVIPLSFIHSPFKDIDERIVYKYSVSQFVTDLFDFS